MFQKYFKNGILLVISIYFILFSSVLIGQTKLIEQPALVDMLRHEKAFLDTSGYTSGVEIGSLAKIVIEAFLGLLAIIFIVLIIIGGYGWMMAGGDESKVTKAKDTIQQAIIGLIITVSAYAITYFVFNALPWGG